MEVEGQWIERLRGVSSAQSRYLWTLVVTGVLFWSIHASLFSPGRGQPTTLTVPLFGVELSPWIVWAAGPATLFFLLLVIVGSVRAYERAHDRLAGSVPAEERESLDVAPNAVDLAVYAEQESAGWIRRLLSLSHPGLLTIFLGEGVWMLTDLVKHRGRVVGSGVFLALGAVTGLAAAAAVISLWKARLLGRSREDR